MLKRLESQERGMTLPEMLVAMTLMLIVLSATLTTLDSGGANRRLIDDRNDAAERARTSIDTVVRQLRNLASPTATAPAAIAQAGATDFAFRTFDPNKRLVRYCLETDGGGINPGVIPTGTSTNLIQMLSTSDVAGSFANCTLTTTGWNGAHRRVAQFVVNKRSPNNIDLFSYNGSTSNTPTITNVRMNLVLDVNTAAKPPLQIRLASGAALRNQNQAPTSSFTVTNLSTRRFILNASGSSDPENRNLSYAWYFAPTATFTPGTTNFIGNGPVLDFTVPTNTPNGTNYFFKLVVSDSNLTDTCPTSTGSKLNCTTAGGSAGTGWTV